MNSGAETLLVMKARGLRHLFATVPAMLRDSKNDAVLKAEEEARAF